jgi:hypothetical protein
MRVIAVEWIRIAYMCRKVRCLPDAGGIFDQDPLHLMRLQVVFEEFDKKEQDDLEAEKHKSASGIR